MHNTKHVADRLIRFGYQHDHPLTGVRLLSMLVIANGWHQALHKKPLFLDPIHSTTETATVSRLLAAFSMIRKRVLPKTQFRSLFFKDEELGDAEAFLERIYHFYKDTPLKELRELAKCGETAWLSSRGQARDGTAFMVMEPELIQVHFEKLLREGHPGNCPLSKRSIEPRGVSSVRQTH